MNYTSVINNFLIRPQYSLYNFVGFALNFTTRSQILNGMHKKNECTQLILYDKIKTKTEKLTESTKNSKPRHLSWPGLVRKFYRPPRRRHKETFVLTPFFTLSYIFLHFLFKCDAVKGALLS